ncbi:hypothetical protein LX32DRAFT_645406 [Colletotrichum zoysiae]|uniref:Uncharacterized protein n=1 Tax=Colletotrichum zoysiae TaxID=1216348 RepID=A0AAD9H5K9_9PEZI|nr:hypothetical protein LX32DRAFT_645406 [Colletotrichum zoysiae]
MAFITLSPSCFSLPFSETSLHLMAPLAAKLTCLQTNVAAQLGCRICHRGTPAKEDELKKTTTSTSSFRSAPRHAHQQCRNKPNLLPFGPLARGTRPGRGEQAQAAVVVAQKLMNRPHRSTNDTVTCSRKMMMEREKKE